VQQKAQSKEAVALFGMLRHFSLQQPDFGAASLLLLIFQRLQWMSCLFSAIKIRLFK
jgi:hypothetical protein